MAYELRFTAYDDADWAQAIELIDNETNGALAEAGDALFELEVTDCGSAVLSATTADGTIDKPAANVLSWRFTESQLGSLCPGTTYRVGIRMTTDDGSIMIGTGTLAFIDGGMA